MTPERWTRIKEVFTEAVELEAGARAAFLAARCGQDLELRGLVDRLLNSHAEAAGFIEASPVRGLAADVASLGPSSGTSRGTYRLGRLIGSGGMGEVYESRDSLTGRRVAIKVLTDNGLGAARRLKREAHHASALDHPHICQIYEVADHEGDTFIAMEIVDGTVVSDAVPESGFEVSKAMQLALQLADAVAHAHARGIIHRDLKCANLMLTADGRLKVLDFGLARRLPANLETAVSGTSLTDPGVIAGTLSHLAPEILRGERADARSDIWAFGIVLHELLTGRQPFEGRTPFELTSSILREPVPGMPGVQAGLHVIRDNCLAKDPGERYQDGGELLLALRALEAGARVRSRIRSSPLKRRLRLAVLTALVLAAAVVGFVKTRDVTQQPATRSVAVLPLEGTSDYFADGVTEALIARLGTIDTLRVLSRTSSARYNRQTALATIRRDLQADVVIRGSVEHTGDEVRLTLEVVDTATERQVWRNTLTRESNEVLALENEAVSDIVARLGIAITPSQQTTLRVARAVDPVMYEAYLKGRFYWNKRTAESLHRAVTFYQSAIERDPTYAPAHAALADCYNQLGTVMLGATSPLGMRPRAKAEAIAAIQADESLAEAHASLGYVSHYDWDWATAEREFRRAIELNPNLALAHTWYANYLASRLRLPEALAEARRAEERDPFSLVVVTNVGWTLAQARRSEEAIAAFRRALALDPTYVQARWRLGNELSTMGRFDEAITEMHKVVEMTGRSPSSLAFLAQSYARAGRRGEAVVLLNEVLSLARTSYVSPVSLYGVYFNLGERDTAFAWVEKALQERSNGVVYIVVDRYFDDVRDDPRYRQIVKRVGLPDAR